MLCRGRANEVVVNILCKNGELTPSACYVLIASLVDTNLNFLTDLRLCMRPYATRKYIYALVDLAPEMPIQSLLKVCSDKCLITWDKFAYYLDRYLYLKDKIEKDRIGRAISENWGEWSILKPTQEALWSKHNCRYCTCQWDEEAAILSQLNKIKNWTYYYRENRIDKYHRKRAKVDVQAYRFKAKEYAARLSLKGRTSHARES